MVYRLLLPSLRYAYDIFINCYITVVVVASAIIEEFLSFHVFSVLCLSFLRLVG